MDDDISIPDWVFKAAAAMLTLFAGLAFGFWHMNYQPAGDAEAAAYVADRPTLVVFDSRTCRWCERFRRDVEPVYQNSRFSNLAPLRYVSIGDQNRTPYTLRGRVTATPTSVLVDRRGHEVGRVRGYPGGGAKAFLPEIEKLLDRVPKEATGSL